MASLLALTFSQPTRNLKSGEILITEGDPGGDLYVLETGRLIVSRAGVTIAAIDTPGALIGEMSVLLGTDSTATVTAEKPTAVRVVTDAIAFLERQPLVTLRVATLLSERLDTTSRLVVEMSHEAGARSGQDSLFNRLMKALTAQPRS